jgi:Cof subfamily protein (haloacid dehalogenase superfamily)
LVFVILSGGSIINTRYKLLVLDIDGTLINKNGALSETDCRALEEVRKAGITISLCTGRVSVACKRILDQLSLDGFHIFFDGALVCDPAHNREIYSRPIEPRLIRKACEAALSCDAAIEFFSAWQYFADKISWRTNIRQDVFGVNPTIIDYQSLWRQDEKIIKAGIIVKSPEEDDKIKRFTSIVKDNLSITWTRTPVLPDLAFINITSLGVSKGKALEALTSYLHVSLKEVAAIGDGTNDLALLTTAGLAIAMHNAPDELKAVADHITADVEHSGVAEAIRRYIL